MHENQETQEPEERRISTVSAVSFLLFCAVVIYLLQAHLIGLFPFQLLDFPTPGTRLVSPLGLYLIYWLGMTGLFSGLYRETKDKLLLGVVLFFVTLAFILILFATL